ncbi:MAG: FAD-dependent oxidoreductase [Sphaerochaetaceae bacterium]|nr:FAD-dependent oxidoreductase [Sphaerochaetaceae bacterium]
MRQSKFDVVVAGGGTAGVIAGLAAARNGAKTLIVEKQRCLGGQFTVGMQGAWVGFSDKEKLIVKGMAWELRNRLMALGAMVEDNPDTDVCFLYDTEIAKIVLDEMVKAESNLSVYLDTSIVDVLSDGDTITGLRVLSESEMMDITSNVVIDCSGDAIVASKAGVPFEIRPKKDIQPMTLMGKMCGVDLDKVKEYYRTHPPIVDHHVPPAWRDFKTFPGFMHFGLHDELEGVELPEHLEYLREWLGIFTSTPHPGEVIINCSGAIEAHSTEGFEEKTAHEAFSQKTLYDVSEAFRKYVPGFENAYLSAIAGLLGIRESRRIIGEYKVTLDDFLAAKEFEDSIGRGAMPAGAHTPDGVTMNVYNLKPGKSMTIPYRCMLPKEKDGLIVAGRCVSYEAPVANCIRCMPQCMVMGEAAGVAASMASKSGCSPKKVNIDLLKKKLLDQGAII